MKTQNLVLLRGYVASEPVEKDMGNGKRCVQFSLKTRDFYKSGTEKKVDKQFHSMILWNGLCEKATDILHKEDIIAIEGKLKNHKVVDAMSGNVYYTTEISISDWTRISSDALESPAFKEVEDQD